MNFFFLIIYYLAKTIKFVLIIYTASFFLEDLLDLLYSFYAAQELDYQEKLGILEIIEWIQEEESIERLKAESDSLNKSEKKNAINFTGSIIFATICAIIIYISR